MPLLSKPPTANCSGTELVGWQPLPHSDSSRPAPSSQDPPPLTAAQAQTLTLPPATVQSHAHRPPGVLSGISHHHAHQAPPIKSSVLSWATTVEFLSGPHSKYIATSTTENESAHQPVRPSRHRTHVPPAIAPLRTTPVQVELRTDLSLLPRPRYRCAHETST
jgi:hypothetical protein